MDIIKSWKLFEAEAETMEVNSSSTLVKRSKKAAAEMDKGAELFNSGKYFEAFKMYKQAQKKDPDYFWAYFNAALSAFNQGSQKAFQYIQSEMEQAKIAIDKMEQDQYKDAAISRYKSLVKHIQRRKG
jgi:tetratricopeptide (TPR) repeat protein